MTVSLLLISSLLAFIREVIQKSLLFKSFTGPTVQEFDDIYKKEITKRYVKHEIKRLSKRKRWSKKRKKDRCRSQKFQTRCKK